MTRANRPTIEVQSARLRDLVTLLEHMNRLYIELETALREQRAAMRSADIDRMQQWDGRARATAARLRERDGLRRQLMELIGGDFGLDRASARTLALSQLAAHLPEASAECVLEVRRQLANVVARVAQANRITQAATRNVLNHMSWVFSAIRPQGNRPDGYDPAGAVVDGGGSAILEAVG